MGTVIIKTGTAPLRREASDASEMVSELLLGETAEVIDTKDRWLEVKCHHDGYPGWVSVAQAHQLCEEDSRSWQKSTQNKRSLNPMFKAVNSRGDILPVPFGSQTGDFSSGLLSFPFGEYSVTDQQLHENRSVNGYASHFMGIPYLWGGRSEFGIDCSGLVQVVFQALGVMLPRDASEQILHTTCNVSSLEDAEEGDLIYFSFDGERVVHVGIYAEDGLIIHASGDVHIDLIDVSKRKTSPYTFNERLANHICGIQRIRLPNKT